MILPSTVSVIVVSWNAKDLLRGCLSSLEQTKPASVMEVIVVDNDSHDGSAEMVEVEFPSVRLIRSGGNLGFAGGNNVGISIARGDALALVNSDALVHPGCLETLLAFLQQTPKAGLVAPKVFGSDGLLQRNSRNLPSLWNTFCRAIALDRLFPDLPGLSGYEVPRGAHQHPHRAQVLSGCFWMARKAAVDQVGMLDERFFFYGEDIDWCKRFADAGWTLHFIPQATATHLGGGSSSAAPIRFSIEMLRATLQYWRKHHGAAGEWLCRLILIFHHGMRLTVRSIAQKAGLAETDRTRHKRSEDAACLHWLTRAHAGGREPGPRNQDAAARH